LLDVVMNSFQVVEHELSRYVGRAAEVFVQPDLGAHTWIEFYRAPEIIECGARAGQAACPEIERVLAERLSGFVPEASMSLAPRPVPVRPSVTTETDGNGEEALQTTGRWSP